MGGLKAAPERQTKRNWTNCSSLAFGKHVLSQLCPSGAASIFQFPLLGLTSAKALFRPLSPAFTSPSPPPPPLWRPQNSALPRKDELTVGSQRLGAPPLARPRPTPSPSAPPHSTSLAPWVPARRRAQPQPQPPTQDPSQPGLPGRLPPRPRPALRPLGGYQLVPPARRRRLTANRRLPHCGRSPAWGLGPPAAGPPGPDARAQAQGLWSRPASAVPAEPRPSRPPLTSPRSHAPQLPSAVPRRGTAFRRGRSRLCLRRAGTH